MCLSADMLAGQVSEIPTGFRPYRLLSEGKVAPEKAESEAGPSMSVHAAMSAPIVWCKEAALAV